VHVHLEDRLRTSAKRCEAHSARGAHGAALVSHLDGLRALWTAEGALAYKSTTEDFLKRVERNRAALLQTWRAALADALRAENEALESLEPLETLDASNEKSFGASRLPSSFSKAELAVGACYWLEAFVERSSTPPGPSTAITREITRAFADHCAKTVAEGSWSEGLEKRLPPLAAVAGFHARLKETLPKPNSTAFQETLEANETNPCADAALLAVARALDSALDSAFADEPNENFDRTKTARENLSGSVSRAVAVSETTLAAFGRARIACAAHVDTLRIVAGVATSTLAAESFDAAFKDRRGRLEEALVGNARRVGANAPSASISFENGLDPRCARASRALDAFARVLEDETALPGDACAEERACAARAFASAGEGLAELVAAALEGAENPKETVVTEFSPEATSEARRVAAFGARALRRLERCIVSPIRSSGSHAARRHSARWASSEDSVASKHAARVEGVALEALFSAVRAAAKPATLALLEGAVAQTWGHHRKPEALPGAQPCSPHIVHWRASALGAFSRLEETLAVEKGPRGRTDPDATRFFGTFIDHVASEALGAYSRIAPSRAWRDRYAWDVRTIVTTVETMERRARRKGRRTAAESASRALAALSSLSRGSSGETLETPPETRAAGGAETSAFPEKSVPLGDLGEHRAGASPLDDRAIGRGLPPELLWRAYASAEGASRSPDREEDFASAPVFDFEAAPWGWFPSSPELETRAHEADDVGESDESADTHSVPDLSSFSWSYDPWPAAKNRGVGFAALESAWIAAEARAAIAFEKLDASRHGSDMDSSAVTSLEPEVEHRAMGFGAETHEHRGDVRIRTAV
jgi:hypothetical protein